MNRLIQECINKDLSVHFPAIASKRGISVDNVAESFKIVQEHDLDGLLRVDHYIPGLDLSIEINGQNHFYPFTKKYHNLSQFKQKLIRQNRLCYVPKDVKDPTVGLPEIVKPDGSLVQRYPLGHDFKYLNLNVHMISDLIKDEVACRQFLRQTLEQLMFEQRLIGFDDAKFFQEKLALI